MDDLGEYESAMSFYIDALEARRSCLGLDDIAVAETLYRYACDLIREISQKEKTGDVESCSSKCCFLTLLFPSSTHLQQHGLYLA